jgi:tetratricopeptide (TPR) repeat protein
MNNNETYYDQIDPYLAGQLSPDMAAALERALQSDPALARELALRRLEFDVSETLIADNIREQMKRLRAFPVDEALSGAAAEADRATPAAGQRRDRTRWLLLTLALLLALGALWWFMPLESQNTDTPPQSQPDLQNNAPAAPDSPVLQKPAPPIGTRPQADKAGKDRRLFAQHFAPYKDPGLEPSRRGADEPLPAEKFRQLYWENRHKEALIVFETMNDADKNNDNLLFVKANCLLATGRTAEAIPLLENILRNDRTRYMAEARWYLALAHLQSGRREQARTLFLEIRADRDSPRQQEAERVLRQWE